MKRNNVAGTRVYMLDMQHAQKGTHEKSEQCVTMIQPAFIHPNRPNHIETETRWISHKCTHIVSTPCYFPCTGKLVLTEFDTVFKQTSNLLDE